MPEMYKPKHRGEPKKEPELCTVCQKRLIVAPGDPGLLGVLCLACFYDL